ncbi:MAG: DUF2490 domain-containing protein [Saprospiraceae bacterium]
MLRILVAISLLFCTHFATAQSVEEDKLGAWYMYFFSADFGDSQFGVQGDYQFRFWDAGGDLEQILLRTGLTYRPKNTNLKFTLGYGNITSGTPGESKDNSNESRVYQELLMPTKVGERFYFTHRFRYEQRWVADQDFRTRYRYNLFLNVVLNQNELGKDALYLALYNELFVNGQRDIGDSRTVELFDRNRTYIGLGYGLFNKARVQLGWMRQTTDNWAKNQAQVSFHQSF